MSMKLPNAKPKEWPKEWFDNDAFWKANYNFMFGDARAAAIKEDIPKLLALAPVKGKSVLDLCCGPGFFAVPLARMGYAVTGVDRTAFLLAKARARARAAKTAVTFVKMDMRDFVRPGLFDLIINMFTSFGYFDDKNEDAAVLKNMFASLKPGGACVIDVLGKEVLAGIFLPSSAEAMPDGTMIVQRREIFDNWSRIRVTWTIISKDAVESFPFHHTLYSGMELKDRMETAGFRDVKLYGSLGGVEYDRNASRLIAVGRKK